MFEFKILTKFVNLENFKIILLLELHKKRFISKILKFSTKFCLSLSI